MRKGIAEERDLVNKLDRLGFAVLRAPASGSRTKLDRPDIIAGRVGLHLALEVKSTHQKTLYVKKESIHQLMRFAEKFGAKGLLAIKFKHQCPDWILLDPSLLTPTEKGYKINLKSAIKTGIGLEALVTKKITDYS
ncbi:MAG: Holliday junction resolvase Hjc [Candidatus Bathyarchaeota archaeon]